MVRAPGAGGGLRAAACGPLPELIDGIRAGGGAITVCTQCAARRDIEQKDLIEGAGIAGSQLFVSEIMPDDVQALVY